MSTVTITPATGADIPFLTGAVMAADKGTGAFAPLARVFGLDEAQLPDLITSMFMEEVDGCEFSVSSFLVGRVDGTPAAAVGGWIEGLPDGVPSQMLRSNLIGYTFPPTALGSLWAHAPVLAPLRIERRPGDLQIEYVYVAPAFRGHGLAATLIQAHLDRAGAASPRPPRAQVQVTSDNAAAIRSYETIGFRKAGTFRSTDPRIAGLMPHPEKLLMEKNLA